MKNGLKLLGRLEKMLNELTDAFYTSSDLIGRISIYLVDQDERFAVSHGTAYGKDVHTLRRSRVINKGDFRAFTLGWSSERNYTKLYGYAKDALDEQFKILAPDMVWSDKKPESEEESMDIFNQTHRAYLDMFLAQIKGFSDRQIKARTEGLKFFKKMKDLYLDCLNIVENGSDIQRQAKNKASVEEVLWDLDLSRRVKPVINNLQRNYMAFLFGENVTEEQRVRLYLEIQELTGVLCGDYERASKIHKLILEGAKNE